MVDIGGGAIVRLLPVACAESETEPPSPSQTNAMKNSTRHLLTAAPTTASSLHLPTTTSESLANSPSGTPNPDDAAGAFTTLPTSAAASPAPVVGDTPVSQAEFTPPKIDVRVESSKIPLDVAVVESILAAGAEDRMKKIAANILIVGGTGMIHNIGFAVESR